MAAVKSVILNAFEVVLCFIRKAWRPATCVGIAGGAIINLCIIPLVNWQVPDMTAAAAYVAASTAAFGVRAWEKQKGLT